MPEPIRTSKSEEERGHDPTRTALPGSESEPRGADSRDSGRSHPKGTPSKLPASRGLWQKWRLFAYDNFVKPLVTSRNPPWYDARGVALGLFIGLGVPVGGHTLALVSLRVVLRFNFLVAAAFTFVNNPLNMVPLCYGYYVLGSAMLGRQADLSLETFEKLIHPVMDKAYFWEAFEAFVGLGCEFLVRWFAAALPIAVVSSIVGYVLAFKAQKRRCIKAAEKMGITYEQLLKNLEAKEHPQRSNSD
jgi:uncharacterized protein